MSVLENICEIKDKVKLLRRVLKDCPEAVKIVEDINDRFCYLYGYVGRMLEEKPRKIKNAKHDV